MNNTEFVSALNEYSFSGENDKILRILNALFDSGEYKAYLNLVFNAISLTQIHLMFLTKARYLLQFR